MRHLLLTLLLFSCAKHNHPGEPASSDKFALVAEKQQLYCEEGRKILNERTFMDDECDSLLFTSLWLTACNVSEFTLDAWHDGGKWYRNPKKDCYPAHSASSLSKDMSLGLMTYWLHFKKLDEVKDFIAFGQEHNWDMCGGDAQDNTTLISRCVLSPALIVLLKDIKKKLSGEPVSLTDLELLAFTDHLEVLRILLTGQVYGGITDSQKASLKSQAESQPHNGLFVGAYEKYSSWDHAADLLLAEDQFPADKLPNNHDNHCTSYLYSRDEGSSDWAPCPAEPFHTFDGTDFVFASHVILEK